MGYAATSPTLRSYKTIYSNHFQGGDSVVVYSNCRCSSAFCFYITFCLFYLWHPVGHWLSLNDVIGKSCSLDFPLVLFYFIPSWVFVFLSRLVSGAGCGIRLYQFLIIAFSLTGASSWYTYDIFAMLQFDTIQVSRFINTLVSWSGMKGNRIHTKYSQTVKGELQITCDNNSSSYIWIFRTTICQLLFSFICNTGMQLHTSVDMPEKILFSTSIKYQCSQTPRPPIYITELD